MPQSKEVWSSHAKARKPANQKPKVRVEAKANVEIGTKSHKAHLDQLKRANDVSRIAKSVVISANVGSLTKRVITRSEAPI